MSVPTPQMPMPTVGAQSALAAVIRHPLPASYALFNAFHNAGMAVNFVARIFSSRQTGERDLTRLASRRRTVSVFTQPAFVEGKG